MPSKLLIKKYQSRIIYETIIRILNGEKHESLTLEQLHPIEYEDDNGSKQEKRFLLTPKEGSFTKLLKYFATGEVKDTMKTIREGLGGGLAPAEPGQIYEKQSENKNQEQPVLLMSLINKLEESKLDESYSIHHLDKAFVGLAKKLKNYKDKLNEGTDPDYQFNKGFLEVEEKINELVINAVGCISHCPFCNRKCEHTKHGVD